VCALAFFGATVYAISVGPVAERASYAVRQVAQASTPVDDANSLDVVVTVVDDQNRPQSGALLEVVDGSTLRTIGRTDSTGTTTVHLKRNERLQARVGSARSDIQVAQTPSLRLVVRLPIISSSTVRAALRGERTTAASARALISGDVTGGLGYVPNYRSSAAGGAGHQSLNGVPLDLPAPPGSAGGSGAIPSDLVSSFDAVQADDGSYPDYHFLSPTTAVSSTLSLAASTFDGSQWKLTTAGPHGTLHYAIALAGGSDEGPLVSQKFADQSGLVYDHGTGAHHTDVSLTGNSALGNVNLSFLGFESGHGAAYIDTNEPGPIVEGLGPNNHVSDDTGLEYLLATWSRGRDSYSAIDGRYAGEATYDFTNALIENEAFPSYSGYRYSGHFDDVTWTRNFASSSLTLKAAASGNVALGFSGDDSALSQGSSSSVTSSGQSFGLTYRRGNSSANVGGSLTAKFLQGPFGGDFIESTAFAQKTIAGVDAHVGLSSTEAQSEEAGYATASILNPPQRADVVCSPGTATVDGPAHVGTTHPRSRTLSFSLTRGGDDGVVRIGGFRSDITNALVSADVADPVLPLAYVAQLNSFFDTLCPSATLTPTNTFVQRYETVDVLRQTEVYADATRQFGHVSLEAFYETFSDSPANTPPDLTGLRTTLAPHLQLADVPLHRAGLIAAFTHRGSMIGFGARLVSANNDAHLPTHVIADGGLRLLVARGTLETSVQNLFGSYVGLLSTPRFAVPLETTGAPLNTLAKPLQRTWTLRYTVGIGPHSQ
jgi:hypothetical protein